MNNPITVKIESNIDITDEHKNELREELVYVFIEQLRKSGIYKVTEEEDGYAWILRADLILPKKHEAEPVKHGRWIIDYAEGTKIYHAHCSECNKEPARNIGGDYYIDKLSDFCPNCGARMDGDSDEKRH